jgi:P4 family phage/plasmid primase-like protien
MKEICMLPIEEPQVKHSYDNDAVRAWIDLLHGTSPGLIHICSVGNWTGRTFSEPTDAADYVARLDASGAEGIYMRTTTLARVPRNEKGQIVRGSVADSLSLPGFAADIDIEGPGHKHDPAKHEGRRLPPDIASAMQIVTESGLPTPTIWVHSGGGLYPWWLLEEVCLIDDPEKLKAAEVAANRIQGILKATAKRLGWHYGAEVGDLARVLRIPGTVNRKAGGAVTAAVLEPASYEFYEISDLIARAEALFRDLPIEQPVRPINPPRILTSGEGLSPGDDFELKTSWSQILLPLGWTFMYQRGRTSYWRRPGKDSGGHSATTGRDPSRDRIYIMSSEAGLPIQEPLTKFHFYALHYHGGDHSAAASHLRRLGGYGGAREPSVARVDLTSMIEPKMVEQAKAPSSPPAPPSDPAPQIDTVPPADYVPSDVGNAVRMKSMFGDSFRWHFHQNTWYQWNQVSWRPDMTNGINQAAVKMTEQIFAEARQLSAEDPKKGEKLYKWGISSQSHQRIRSAISQFAAQPNVTAVSTDFDARRELITVANGTLNLLTGELGPHDPKLMLTRVFGARYDKAAKAPKFEAFLAQLMPDPTVRDYIQRAMGYTLAGEVDERSIFILYGPSGTGKSQFLSLMTKLFADFGGTAAAAALRVNRSGQTNDLHGLRGKRFVATSETSERAVLDEELIKRLTGSDEIVSRDLYEKNQSWDPECSIWMATNFLPQLDADDSAIWARVKPIHFNTQFSRDGANKAIPDIGAKILAEEASGILNWLLAGLAKYRESGLGEPGAVKASVAQHKLESDNVAQFIEDGLAEGLIVEAAEEMIDSGHLFRIYQEWCGRNMLKPLGAKKVVRRLIDMGYMRKRKSTWHWVGLRVGTSHGILGTM